MMPQSGALLTNYLDPELEGKTGIWGYYCEAFVVILGSFSFATQV